MKRILTCICCPLGCEITVDADGKNILSVTGNGCKRGEDYAKTECTNPMRTVTSTIMSTNGTPIPVKTEKPIAKDKIFEAMKAINGICVNTPVKVGDVAAENIFGSRLVITADCE